MKNEDTPLERGRRIRAEVLGDAHVSKSLKGASDFDRDMQELATSLAWGTIWSREGLSRSQRSMITVAMTAAMGRSHELGVHVRGAITNGVTQEEISEILMQVAVYAGLPLGMEAFRVARAVIDSDQTQPPE